MDFGQNFGTSREFLIALQSFAKAQSSQRPHQKFSLGSELMFQKTIEMRVNGMDYTILAYTHWTLLQLLRDHLGLTGTKEGCGNGECGACSVIFNGKIVRSCLILACEADKSEILTIEGLGKGKDLDLIQKAFIEAGAVQCGFCSPGFIMAAKALLMSHPNPTKKQISQAFSGHLCRCTGYETVFQAVEIALNLYKQSS
jgi:carbon-monoxide dehydrogenase small subunit